MTSNRLNNFVLIYLQTLHITFFTWPARNKATSYEFTITFHMPDNNYPAPECIDKNRFMWKVKVFNFNVAEEKRNAAQISVLLNDNYQSKFKDGFDGHLFNSKVTWAKPGHLISHSSQIPHKCLVSNENYFHKQSSHDLWQYYLGHISCGDPILTKLLLELLLIIFMGQHEIS